MNAKTQAENILKKIASKHIKKVKVAVTDTDGVMRGKLMHIDKLKSALKNGFGFCNVVFGWDCQDQCYEDTYYSGWASGYPDAQVSLDPATYREVPWDHKIPFLIGDFYENDANSLPYCPRGVLKKVIKISETLGYQSIVGCEYEWFNFKETPESLNEKDFHKPTPLTPGMFGYSLLRSGNHRGYFNQLMDQMEEFGVPLEGLHTETGPGVYEAAIKCSNALEAADRASLFKMATKEIAAEHKIIPSFMARWNDSLPGCSGHIHQSLQDAKGQNAFVDENDEHGMSEVFKHYLAGLIQYTPELLVLMAPTVNSYKRLVKGFWAPTSPSWGFDNRTCAMRVLSHQGAATRVEMRVPGSDVNPYLAVSASLLAGLKGVELKLELKQAAVVGNAYEQASEVQFPSNLKEAAERFYRSSLARKAFGDDFVEHFVKTRIWEWEQSQKHISDWELKRYFEII